MRTTASPTAEYFKSGAEREISPVDNLRYSLPLVLYAHLLKWMSSRRPIPSAPFPLALGSSTYNIACHPFDAFPIA